MIVIFQISLICHKVFVFNSIYNESSSIKSEEPFVWHHFIPFCLCPWYQNGIKNDTMAVLVLGHLNGIAAMGYNK